MKVLLVVPGGVTVDGQGVVIPVLSAFARSLALRCDVCVLVVNRQREASCENAAQLTIIKPGKRPFGLAGLLGDIASSRRLLRHTGFEYDVIHSFWLGRPSVFAWALRGRKAIPWIASVGGQELSDTYLRRHGPVERKIFRGTNRIAFARADLVTCGSSMLRDVVATSRCSALWWPLFPDKSLFKPVAVTERDVSRPFRIITVADHNNAKDVPTLLRAIRELKRRGHSISLQWIGQELQPGRSLELAGELGIVDCVHMHGHVPHSAIPGHLRNADLYLQSSSYESQGVSVCEAAMCGLPIVGTAVGILPELCPDGALAVEAGNPVALADAVEQVIVDADRRSALGLGAAKWISEYSLDWTVEQALQFYEALISGARFDSGDWH